MTRTERLLRLARERGDLAAVAILEAPDHTYSDEGCPGYPKRYNFCPDHVMEALAVDPVYMWSEAEMRAAWGDR